MLNILKYFLMHVIAQCARLIASEWQIIEFVDINQRNFKFRQIALQNKNFSLYKLIIWWHKYISLLCINKGFRSERNVCYIASVLFSVGGIQPAAIWWVGSSRWQDNIYTWNCGTERNWILQWSSTLSLDAISKAIIQTLIIS